MKKVKIKRGAVRADNLALSMDLKVSPDSLVVEHFMYNVYSQV